MRVYIESTIPSFLVARPSRFIKQAARQETTHDWWENRRRLHDLFTSQVVIDEISEGELAMAERRLAVLQNVTLLAPSENALAFAGHIIQAGILPVRADRDSAHIAIATIHKMDILLTWNCRHLANASIQERLRRAAAKLGYQLPTICTPDELMN